MLTPNPQRLHAIERLRALLRPSFLRDYLTAEVERLVTACEPAEGRRRKVPDQQLPELLLDLHGSEILRDRKVRQEIVDRLDGEIQLRLLESGKHDRPRGRKHLVDQIVTRTWHPGKAWAIRFCTLLDIPLGLAGEPDGGSGPPSEELTPYVPLPPLHDFQADLARRLGSILAESAQGRRGLLSLPTGAGKTRTCVEALVLALRQGTLREGHVLWIAQSEELCEQAVQAFREVWTHQTVEAAIRHQADPPELAMVIHRLWGSRSMPEELVSGGIFVASIQKLDSLRDAGQLDPLVERAVAVVVDEAHHAVAPSYTKLFNALGITHRGSQRALIGLTATPYRGNEAETKRLVQRFAPLLVPPWDNAVQVLRERSILARAEVCRVETLREFTLDPDELRHYETFSDLPDKTLRKIGKDVARNQRILTELLQIRTSSPVLFFACSVNHARAMALLLRRQGRSAVAVTGETPRSLRRQWIHEFKDGAIQFLCNYGILTTGFDAPRVENVVISRPTTSVLLYEQMVGRGMRGPRNGGTDSCTIVDMVDIFPQFGEQMSYARYRKMWQEFSQHRRELEAGESEHP